MEYYWVEPNYDQLTDVPAYFGFWGGGKLKGWIVDDPERVKVYYFLRDGFYSVLDIVE